MFRTVKLSWVVPSLVIPLLGVGCDASSSATSSAKASSQTSATPSLKDKLSSAAANNALEASPAKAEGAEPGAEENQKPKIKLEDIHFNRENPGFIVPCYFLRNNLYANALKKDKYLVEFTINYTSGGKEVTKVATVHVKDATIMEEDPRNNDKTKFTLLDSKVQIEQVPDRGSLITGTAKLLKNDSDPPSLEDETTARAPKKAE